MIPSFVHGSSSQADGNSEDPDGEKVGWLFTNYENGFLDTMASPDDRKVLNGLDYSKQADAVYRALGGGKIFLI